MDKDWIKQADVRRRRYAPLTWIPLYLNRETQKGEYGEIGYVKDDEAVRTAAIHLDKRAELGGLGFVDLAYVHGPSTWNGYTPCDARLSREGEVQGVYLALKQSFDGDSPSVWSLNQDFVFALDLARKDDVWVRPSEGFVEVAKIERRANGDVESILVRPEYLKDYLAARSMALMIGSYRERRWIVPDLSSLPYNEDDDEEATDEFGRHTFYVRPIVAGGFPYGGGIAVFNASRTDQWDDDEVPILGPETVENTSSSQTHFTREGEKLFSLTSERRLTEWLEPAAVSPRVRRDEVPSATLFLVDAQGSQTNADKLDFEEVGLWLFFRPTVISDILGRRGSSINWHTRFTASVSLSGGIPIHFGTNKADLVVAYAHDIARQPEWQRRIWAAHNVAPEGGLGEELDAAQVRARPASTLAPEGFIAASLEVADNEFRAQWGVSLLRAHQDRAEIISRSHRFRSLDQAGFLSLAKDLARLSADLIDQKALHSIAAPDQGQGTGSLRSLERVLATVVSATEARKLTSKLAGIYELRLGDAHLPSSKLEEAMTLTGIPPEESWLVKGAYMIHQFVSSFYSIAQAVSANRDNSA
jgi:hypothetical protein